MKYIITILFLVVVCSVNAQEFDFGYKSKDIKADYDSLYKLFEPLILKMAIYEDSSPFSMTISKQGEESFSFVNIQTENKEKAEVIKSFMPIVDESTKLIFICYQLIRDNDTCIVLLTDHISDNKAFFYYLPYTSKSENEIEYGTWQREEHEARLLK